MTNAFVFPGQGSQAIGMGKALADHYAAARAVFEEVDDALGEKLSDIIFNGPEDQLTLTANTQPALMAVSLAALRALGERVIGHYTTGWIDGPFQSAHHASKLGGPRDGWLARWIVLPANAIARAPAFLDDAAASTLPVSGLTAWTALQRLQLAPGASVLVQGSGSFFNLQFLALPEGGKEAFSHPALFPAPTGGIAFLTAMARRPLPGGVVIVAAAMSPVDHMRVEEQGPIQQNVEQLHIVDRPQPQLLAAKLHAQEARAR